ncbi:hypothetical protein ASZ90_014946 [hydrocarbon metagenome]|uniref:Uncharacterized protein n=1 Tax=hydrocarbon metagenome TaxID=938273 RepID=A0A0W8F3C8_9ZZZZ
MVLQEFCDPSGILRMAGDPEVECLQAEQEEPCVERAQDCTGVAHQRDPDLEGECNVPEPGKISKRFPVLQAMVARVRIGELGELPIIPRKLSGVHDHSPDGIPMAADVLGRREHRDICAMPDWPDKPHPSGVVDHEGDTCLVSRPCNCLEVRDIQLRVPNGLRVDCPCFVVYCLSECIRVCGIDKDDTPAKLGERVVEELVRAAVQVVCRDDLIAGTGYVQEGVGDGSLPGSGRDGTGPSLDCRHALLEDIRRRVHEPGVDIAELAKAEQVCGMFGTPEDVRACLVDRYCPCPGRGAGFLPCVQGSCS